VVIGVGDCCTREVRFGVVDGRNSVRERIGIALLHRPGRRDRARVAGLERVLAGVVAVVGGYVRVHLVDAVEHDVAEQSVRDIVLVKWRALRVGDSNGVVDRVADLRQRVARLVDGDLASRRDLALRDVLEVCAELVR
jgi:hypothetical protein